MCQEDERRRRRDNQPEGHAKRMSNGGNATTSRKRVTGGHGATRGNGAMRGVDAGRLEAAAAVEATRQPAGLEVQERQNGRQWRNVRRSHTTVMQEDGAGGRCSHQPWAGEAMGGGRRVTGCRETTQQLAGADENETRQEAEAEGRASWRMWC